MRATRGTDHASLTTPAATRAASESQSKNPDGTTWQEGTQHVTYGHNTTHYIFIGKREVIWTSSYSGYFEEKGD